MGSLWLINIGVIDLNSKGLQQSEYDQFRLFLEQQWGIVLGENKQYLVKSRLAPLMSRFNVESLS